MLPRQLRDVRARRVTRARVERDQRVDRARVAGRRQHALERLHLSWAALRAAPGSTAVLNAANEIAVEAFLDGRLRFDGIHRVNAQALERVLPAASDAGSIDALIALDVRARDAARAHVAQLAGQH